MTLRIACPSRRAFLGALPLSLLAVPHALAQSDPSVLRVEDFGPLGEGDDTPTIQRALDAARSATGPMFGTKRRATALLFPDRAYSVSSLDATNAIGLSLIGKSGPWGATLYADRQTVPGPVIDFTGSLGCTAEGLTVAAMSPGGDRPAVLPTVGWLIAASLANGDCTANYFTHCNASGWFQRAAAFCFGATDLGFTYCNFEQWNPHAPALVVTAHNPDAITSPFQSIAGGVQVTGEITFHQSGAGNQLGAATASAVLVYNAYALRFFGGVLGGSGPTHVRFWGDRNRTILFEGVQFESETAIPADYAFYAEGAVVQNLTVLACDFEHNGFRLALTGGSGQFPGLVVLGVPGQPNRCGCQSS